MDCFTGRMIVCAAVYTANLAYLDVRHHVATPSVSSRVAGIQLLAIVESRTHYRTKASVAQ